MLYELPCYKSPSPIELKVQGRVMEGHRRGRTLGFPTANLELKDFPQVKTGIYAGFSEIRYTDEESSPRYPSIISISRNPCYENDKLTFEVFLIHEFPEDHCFYGEQLAVEIQAFIRRDFKFVNEDGSFSENLLIQTMHQDVKETLRFLEADETRV